MWLLSTLLIGIHMHGKDVLCVRMTLSRDVCGCGRDGERMEW